MKLNFFRDNGYQGWKSPWKPINPPLGPDFIICPHCGKNSGIDRRNLTNLYISPPGLACHCCGEICVQSQSFYC